MSAHDGRPQAPLLTSTAAEDPLRFKDVCAPRKSPHRTHARTSRPAVCFSGVPTGAGHPRQFYGAAARCGSFSFGGGHPPRTAAADAAGDVGFIAVMPPDYRVA